MAWIVEGSFICIRMCVCVWLEGLWLCLCSLLSFISSSLSPYVLSLFISNTSSLPFPSLILPPLPALPPNMPPLSPSTLVSSNSSVVSPPPLSSPPSFPLSSPISSFLCITFLHLYRPYVCLSGWAVSAEQMHENVSSYLSALCEMPVFRCANGAAQGDEGGWFCCCCLGGFFCIRENCAAHFDSLRWQGLNLHGWK